MKSLLNLAFAAATLTSPFVAKADCQSPFNQQLRALHYISLPAQIDDDARTYRIVDVKKQMGINAVGIKFSTDPSLKFSGPVSTAQGLAKDPTCFLKNEFDDRDMRGSFYVVASSEQERELFYHFMRSHTHAILNITTTDSPIGDSTSLSKISVSMDEKDFSGFQLSVIMASFYPVVNEQVGAKLYNLVRNGNIDLEKIDEKIQSGDQVIALLKSGQAHLSPVVDVLRFKSDKVMGDDEKFNAIHAYAYLISLKLYPPLDLSLQLNEKNGK